MAKTTLKFIVLTFFTIISASCATRTITATHWQVVRIIDGDTFVVGGYDGEDAHVRIVGIDTPERRHDGYTEATDDLRAMIEGRRVKLSFPTNHKRDSFGRLLVDAEVDGVDVGAAMLAKGWPAYADTHK